MAPIPSLLSLETQEVISSLSRKQQDIFDFQIPRLRKCAGPLATQQQFAAELREDVDAFARRVEELDGEVHALRVERSRRELRAVVDEFNEVVGRYVRCTFGGRPSADFALWVGCGRSPEARC